MERALKSFLACTLVGVATNVEAVDCSAACPDRPLGILAAPFGVVLVSPSAVTAGFTGCQIAWDVGGNIRIVFEFVSGNVKRVEAFNVSKDQPHSLCFYQNGKATDGSPPECNDFLGHASPFLGLDAMPVDETQIDWPEKQCLPTMRDLRR
jgi:hypothetical protein